MKQKNADSVVGILLILAYILAIIISVTPAWYITSWLMPKNPDDAWINFLLIWTISNGAFFVLARCFFSTIKWVAAQAEKIVASNNHSFV